MHASEVMQITLRSQAEIHTRSSSSTASMHFICGRATRAPTRTRLGFVNPSNMAAKPIMHGSWFFAQNAARALPPPHFTTPNPSTKAHHVVSTMQETQLPQEVRAQLGSALSQWLRFLVAKPQPLRSHLRTQIAPTQITLTPLTPSKPRPSKRLACRCCHLTSITTACSRMGLSLR